MTAAIVGIVLALAGDDMPAARRDCLPVVAIYRAATGR